MPQMAPMWWTTLFMFFSMTLISIMIKTYFLTEYKLSNMKMEKEKIKINNWMW